MKRYILAATMMLFTIFLALFFRARGTLPKVDKIDDDQGQETSFDASQDETLSFNRNETTNADDQETDKSQTETTKEDPPISTQPHNPQENLPAGAEADTSPSKIQRPKTIEVPSNPIGLQGKKKNLSTIERIVYAAGFLYDAEQNIFYSDSDPWQKNFGFTSVYDAFAKFGAMIYETKRFKFSYAGHDWMFQVWKGRYGITSGAEIGIYYKDQKNEGDFYHCVDYDKYIAMDLKLYKDGKLYLFRDPVRHWWLTGFRLGEMIDAKEFLMEFTFYLDYPGMADALERAVINEGFVKDDTYIRDGNNIRIFW